MVKPLVVYPDRAISYASADVREFDEKLVELISDMKDTMEAVGASALAAIQVGVSQAVVLIKQDDGEYLEIINPKVIRKTGSVESKERTLYLPGIERTIKRYEKISLVYQDRKGEQHSLKAEGDLGCVIQRKVDYVFGSSFVGKMTEQERDDVEMELHGKGVQGGTFDDYSKTSKREYIKGGIIDLMVLQGLLFFTALFGFGKETMDVIYAVHVVGSAVIVSAIIGYYFYSRYEANKRMSCTGCQVVSFLAVSLKFLGVELAMFGIGYLLLKP